ncbi:glycoside hydrolase [Asticcacaulis sp. AND118]|uniref:glycoside hydrolase n=1 Tax=Asticcacaulis sp. AND118 TaxID=2840468 RepID=UPI001CFFCD1A|nr:glycoside hydrolase [Asticcacaulis sp. AND118]UDF05527.1 glycoside hydrolase [Asticcacaulis sp. AND118]
MRVKGIAAALLMLAAMGGPVKAASGITPPPSFLGLDPFYRQYLDANGIPVVGSAQVPEAAMQAARDIVVTLLVHRPDLRDTLIRSGARVGVMAQSETTTDLPEQRHWKKPAIDDPRLSKCDVRDYATTIGRMSDRDYWDARARGMGGFYTTGAAENLLAVPGTRYYGENILVHEFSHNILNAIRTRDPALMRRVDAAFQNAKAKGLWRAAYMALNVDEYWAEGTQFWFNSNMAYRLDALVVVDDADLKHHDPPLYAVLAEVYGRNHHIRGDAFYRHAARLNSRPADLKNDCYS